MKKSYINGVVGGNILLSIGGLVLLIALFVGINMKLNLIDLNLNFSLDLSLVKFKLKDFNTMLIGIFLGVIFIIWGLSKS